MKAFIGAAALAAGASAAVVGRGDDKCCFQLSATGGVSGTVGQLSDGQNRVGGGYPPATYCITNGSITDSSGRGCILTPPTTQFQCDVGATPTPGFSITSSGEVEYNGSGTFYACPADNGIYNIYTTPVPNQAKCVKIELNSNGKCLPPPPPPPTTSAPPPPPATTTCPAPITSTVTVPTTIYATKTVWSVSTAWSTTTVVSSVSYCPTPSTVTITTTVAPPPPPGSTITITKTIAPPPPPGTTVTVTHVSTIAPPPPPPGSTVIITTTIQPPPPPPVTVYTTTTPIVVPPPVTITKSYQNTTTIVPPTSTKPTSTSTGCPTSLAGAYQTPHLIVPISSSQPDHAYGTQYNATITPSEATIFNFDIPQSYSGKTCNVIFSFPLQSQLVTSSFNFNNQGGLSVSLLSSAANQQTTWNNAPKAAQSLSSFSIAPGNSYTISSGACSAGSTVSYEVSSTGGASLDFFEDYNPCALGVFITTS